MPRQKFTKLSLDTFQHQVAEKEKIAAAEKIRKMITLSDLVLSPLQVVALPKVSLKDIQLQQEQEQDRPQYFTSTCSEPLPARDVDNTPTNVLGANTDGATILCIPDQKVDLSREGDDETHDDEDEGEDEGEEDVLTNHPYDKPQMEKTEFIKLFRQQIRNYIVLLRKFHSDQANFRQDKNISVDYEADYQERKEYAMACWKKYQFDTKLDQQYNPEPLTEILDFILNHRVHNRLVEFKSYKESDTKYHSRPIKQARLCLTDACSPCPLKKYLDFCDLVHLEDIKDGALVNVFLPEDEDDIYDARGGSGLAFIWRTEDRIFHNLFRIQRVWKNSEEKQSFFVTNSKALQGLDYECSANYSVSSIVHDYDLNNFNKFHYVLSFEEVMIKLKLKWNIDQFTQFAKIGTKCSSFLEDHDSYLLNKLLNGTLTEKSLLDTLACLPENLNLEDAGTMQFSNLQVWALHYGPEFFWKHLNNLHWIQSNHSNFLKESDIKISKSMKYKEPELKTECICGEHSAKITRMKFADQVMMLKLTHSCWQYMTSSGWDHPDNKPKNIPEGFILNKEEPGYSGSYGYSCQEISDFLLILFYMLIHGGNSNTIKAGQTFLTWLQARDPDREFEC